MTKEVILRLQYPEEVGAVGECELEGILSKLQRVGTCNCEAYCKLLVNRLRWLENP